MVSAKRGLELNVVGCCLELLRTMNSCLSRRPTSDSTLCEMRSSKTVVLVLEL